jgi:hypothetical protein
VIPPLAWPSPSMLAPTRSSAEARSRGLCPRGDSGTVAGRGRLRPFRGPHSSPDAPGTDLATMAVAAAYKAPPGISPAGWGIRGRDRGNPCFSPSWLPHPMLCYARRAPQRAPIAWPPTTRRLPAASLARATPGRSAAGLVALASPCSSPRGGSRPRCRRRRSRRPGENALRITFAQFWSTHPSRPPTPSGPYVDRFGSEEHLPDGLRPDLRPLFDKLPPSPL